MKSSDKAQSIFRGKDEETLEPRDFPEFQTFYPTMEQFCDFENFIRHIESTGAHKAGICKIVPPKEWIPRKKGYCPDDFEGEVFLKEPSEQNFVTRDKGVHQYARNGLVNRPMTVAQFHKMATNTVYRTPQHESFSELERKYWRSIHMCPPIYGADVSNSITDPEIDAFNMAKLERQCVLKHIKDDLDITIPGVNSPYLYFGMWKATFVWHVEDMDLYGINFLHHGAPKTWYTVPPQYGHLLEKLCARLFPDFSRNCTHFMRHKACLLSPAVMKENNVPFQTVVQEERDIIIVFPFAYHSGFNHGFNIAESTNFGSERWIEYGKRYRPCDCTRRNVKIDMGIFVKRYQPELWERWQKGRDIQPHPEDPEDVQAEINWKAKDPIGYAHHIHADKIDLTTQFYPCRDETYMKVNTETFQFIPFRGEKIVPLEGAELLDFEEWKRELTEKKFANNNQQEDEDENESTLANAGSSQKKSKFIHLDVYKHVDLPQINVSVLRGSYKVLGRKALDNFREMIGNHKINDIREYVENATLFKASHKTKRRKLKNPTKGLNGTGPAAAAPIEAENGSGGQQPKKVPLTRKRTRGSKDDREDDDEEEEPPSKAPKKDVNCQYYYVKDPKVTVMIKSDTWEFVGKPPDEVTQILEKTNSSMEELISIGVFKEKEGEKTIANTSSSSRRNSSSSNGSSNGSRRNSIKSEKAEVKSLATVKEEKPKESPLKPAGKSTPVKSPVAVEAKDPSPEIKRPLTESPNTQRIRKKYYDPTAARTEYEVYRHKQSGREVTVNAKTLKPLGLSGKESIQELIGPSKTFEQALGENLFELVRKSGSHNKSSPSCGAGDSPASKGSSGGGSHPSTVFKICRHKETKLEFTYNPLNFKSIGRMGFKLKQLLGSKSVKQMVEDGDLLILGEKTRSDHRHQSEKVAVKSYQVFNVCGLLSVVVVKLGLTHIYRFRKVSSYREHVRIFKDKRLEELLDAGTLKEVQSHIPILRLDVMERLLKFGLVSKEILECHVAGTSRTFVVDKDTKIIPEDVRKEFPEQIGDKSFDLLLEQSVISIELESRVPNPAVAEKHRVFDPSHDVVVHLTENARYKVIEDNTLGEVYVYQIEEEEPESEEMEPLRLTESSQSEAEHERMEVVEDVKPEVLRIVATSCNGHSNGRALATTNGKSVDDSDEEDFKEGESVAPAAPIPSTSSTALARVEKKLPPKPKTKPEEAKKSSSIASSLAKVRVEKNKPKKAPEPVEEEAEKFKVEKKEEEEVVEVKQEEPTLEDYHSSDLESDVSDSDAYSENERFDADESSDGDSDSSDEVSSDDDDFKLGRYFDPNQSRRTKGRMSKKQKKELKKKKKEMMRLRGIRKNREPRDRNHGRGGGGLTDLARKLISKCESSSVPNGVTGDETENATADPAAIDTQSIVISGMMTQEALTNTLNVFKGLEVVRSEEVSFEKTVDAEETHFEKKVTGTAFLALLSNTFYFFEIVEIVPVYYEIVYFLALLDFAKGQLEAKR